MCMNVDVLSVSALCFTSTKAQLLTPEELLALSSRIKATYYAHFTCCTSTKVQGLTPAELRQALSVTHHSKVCVCVYTQFTYSTSTRVQIQTSRIKERYAVYLLYSYKSANNDTRGAAPCVVLLTYADVCGRMLTYADIC